MRAAGEGENAELYLRGLRGTLGGGANKGRGVHGHIVTISGPARLQSETANEGFLIRPRPRPVWGGGAACRCKGGCRLAAMACGAIGPRPTLLDAAGPEWLPMAPPGSPWQPMAAHGTGSQLSSAAERGGPGRRGARWLQSLCCHATPQR